MSDSGNGSGVLGTVGEIVKDVAKFGSDSLSDVAETVGIGSAPSGTQNNTSSTKATPDEIKQTQFVRARIEKLKQDQARVVQQNQAQETQRLQVQTQETQAQASLSSDAKINPAVRVDIQASRPELKDSKMPG